MKKIIAYAIALASILFGTTVFAAQDKPTYNVTPLVGYQFQTKNVVNKQERFQGEAQKNHFTYGIQATKDLGNGLDVGGEYIRTDSNVNSWQLGVVANQSISDHFYATSGLGYTKLKTPNTLESAYLNLGAGVKVPLTDIVDLRTEVRAQYALTENQWTPVALVSLQFKTF